MGLVKRNHVWWMSFMYQGRQVRRSTGTTDKRLAESILCKVKVQIAEGQFFERREEAERTFQEMMDRYVQERAVMKAPKSRERDRAALHHLLPVFGNKVLAEISPSCWPPTRSSDGPSKPLLRRSTKSCSSSVMRSIWRCGNGNGAGRIPCIVCLLSRCGTRWIVG